MHHMNAEPVAPMCFLRAKPIGLMPMLDQGEQDDKVRDHVKRASLHDCVTVPRASNVDLRLSQFWRPLQIIAVHADDPEFSGFKDISEIPKHRLAEIKRFCECPA